MLAKMRTIRMFLSVNTADSQGVFQLKKVKATSKESFFLSEDISRADYCR